MDRYGQSIILAGMPMFKVEVPRNTVMKPCNAVAMCYLSVIMTYLCYPSIYLYDSFLVFFIQVMATANWSTQNAQLKTWKTSLTLTTLIKWLMSWAPTPFIWVFRTSDIELYMRYGFHWYVTSKLFTWFQVAYIWLCPHWCNVLLTVRTAQKSTPEAIFATYWCWYWSSTTESSLLPFAGCKPKQAQKHLGAVTVVILVITQCFHIIIQKSVSIHNVMPGDLDSIWGGIYYLSNLCSTQWRFLLQFMCETNGIIT